MEVCREEVQEEDYEIQIHFVEATNLCNLYDYLRFLILAGNWLPQPVGVCVWSLIHILLALLHTLALLACFILCFVVAVCMDILNVCALLGAIIFIALGYSLYVIVIAPAAWTWYLITCSLPERTPGQSLVHFILSGRIPLAPGDSQNFFDFQGDSRSAYHCLCDDCILDFPSTRQFVVRFLTYWRLKVTNWWQEILPSYDAIVI